MIASRLQRRTGNTPQKRAARLTSKSFLGSMICGVALWVAVSPALAQRGPESLAPLADKLIDAVVNISSTQISRCTALLDTGLQAWRTRPLDETPYVILDARYVSSPACLYTNFAKR